MKTLIIAMFFVLASSPSHSVSEPKLLGKEELFDIVYTAGNNELAFKNKYKGRMLKVDVYYNSVDKNLFFEIYNFKGTMSGHEIKCTLNNLKYLKQLGDIEQGEIVEVTGMIRDTIFGDLWLEDGCRLTFK